MHHLLFILAAHRSPAARLQNALILKALAPLLLLMVIGCRENQIPPVALPPQSQPQPYVLHLPGIGGYLPVDRSLMRGLRTGGVTGTITHYDWTSGDPGMRALFNDTNKSEQADHVAQILLALHRTDPQRPIILIGHSGGAGIAVWALERLPDDVRIHRLILLAPALSPAYDLSRALRHVTDRAYALISPHDPVLAATRVFGTIDGVRVEAAGRVGFVVPSNGDAAYARLHQLPYRHEWMALGHLGDHIGMMHPAFAAKILAPLVMGEHAPR